jgi:hypothetical protein
MLFLPDGSHSCQWSIQAQRNLLLNHCRQYLQALTVSDIMTADGIELDYAKFYGHHHPALAAPPKYTSSPKDALTILHGNCGTQLTYYGVTAKTLRNHSEHG